MFCRHLNLKIQRIPCKFSTIGCGDIEVEVLKNVGNVGINLVHQNHKLDEQSFKLLIENIASLNLNPNITAISLYGIGGSFCSGSTAINALPLCQLISPKPLVGAMTGYTTGFGFELAMFCDFRVMEDTAEIGLGSKFNEEITESFARRLISSIGLPATLDLLLTRRLLKAREAADIGLIHRVVECGTGIGQAFALAKEVGKFPSKLNEQYKKTIYQGV